MFEVFGLLAFGIPQLPLVSLAAVVRFFKHYLVRERFMVVDGEPFTGKHLPVAQFGAELWVLI